jgi:two-component system response regulator
MENKNRIKPISLLLVDDDQGDVELTLEVMEMSKIKLDVNVVSDGVEAMQYLKKEGDFQQAIRPDLILLDLNMPRKNGKEVLQEIRQHPSLRTIPIVILTTSDADEDIMNTYTLGANCYITKPVGLAQFQKEVEAIDNFWFSVVKYPSIA